VGVTWLSLRLNPKDMKMRLKKKKARLTKRMSCKEVEHYPLCHLLQYNLAINQIHGLNHHRTERRTEMQESIVKWGFVVEN
jgi:hypothetical protein